MIRQWVTLMALVLDTVPLWLVLLFLILGATIVATLWYTWPAWLPGRWPRRSAARSVDEATEAVEVPPHRAEEPVAAGLLALPAATAAELMARADAFAASGRYAEAIRERLRASIHDLVAVGVIEHRPEWTVIELVTAATQRTPDLGGPLRGAGALFSDIWYGMRPATMDDDDRMRHLAAEVAARLEIGQTP